MKWEEKKIETVFSGDIPVVQPYFFVINLCFLPRNLSCIFIKFKTFSTLKVSVNGIYIHGCRHTTTFTATLLFFCCIIIILFLCRSFSTQMLLLVSVTKSQEWFIFLFLINEKCVRKKKFMKNFIGKEDILQFYLWRIQKRISRVFETDTATTLTWDHANPVTSVSIKSLLCGRRSLGINNENIYLNICMFLSHDLHGRRLGKVHRMHPLI